MLNLLYDSQYHVTLPLVFLDCSRVGGKSLLFFVFYVKLLSVEILDS